MSGNGVRSAGQPVGSTIREVSHLERGLLRQHYICGAIVALELRDLRGETLLPGKWLSGYRSHFLAWTSRHARLYAKLVLIEAILIVLLLEEPLVLSIVKGHLLTDGPDRLGYGMCSQIVILMHDYPMLVEKLGSFLYLAIVLNLQIPSSVPHLPLIVHAAESRVIYLAYFGGGWLRLVAHHVLQFGCLDIHGGSLPGTEGDVLPLHLLSAVVRAYTLPVLVKLALTLMLLSYLHLGRVD